MQCGLPTRPPAGAPTVYASDRRQRSLRGVTTCPSAGSVTDDDRRQTVASKNNTGSESVVTSFECRCNTVLPKVKNKVSGRNRTGPPCGVGRPRVHLPACADRSRARTPAVFPASLYHVPTRWWWYRRRLTTDGSN